jgi:4-hydroxy-3-methylbut-2-en-1-yl diphosphate reductase
MKSFVIPDYYKSRLISKLKEERKLADPKKKDFTPTILDFGSIKFLISRHFGFCYGVENAIEISYRAVEENLGKKIFLLSQMIHNPEVNADLESKGIQFIMDTNGKQLLPWEAINKEDIVIIPAFGTTLETEKLLQDKGIEIFKYNTTCPFVERVWKKSEKLGSDQFTIIIHGKHNHEETRATFSHSKEHSHSVIIKDIHDAQKLGDIILGNRLSDEFYVLFKGMYSEGFNAKKDLERIGVVNQTTMLASETQEIADYLKTIVAKKFGINNLKDHYADTRDTLCYATNDNQQATLGLLAEQADLAIVVGGYNSSNTSHLVELCEKKFPTYYISSEKEIESKNEIAHFDIHKNTRIKTENFLPTKNPLTIALTSGASCPDSVVDRVLLKILMFYGISDPEKFIKLAN